MEKFRIGFGTSLSQMLHCKKIGADYQEVSLRDIYRLTDDEFDECIALAEKNGISYEAGKNLIPGDLQFTVDNPDFDKISKYLDVIFSRAKKMGISIAVLGSGAARDYPEGVTYEQGIERLVYFLKNYMVPVCEKYGIVCALENLSFNESNMLNTIDESYMVVRAVDSEWIKILVDFYHFGRNRDSFDSIRKAKDYIVHTHFASVKNDRIYPAPNDGDNYKECIDLLREIGYTGRLSFEAHEADGDSFEEVSKIALDYFRTL